MSTHVLVFRRTGGADICKSFHHFNLFCQYAVSITYKNYLLLACMYIFHIVQYLK